VQLIITDTYNELSRTAATVAVDFLLDNPTTPTVIPTGNTPLGMYRELIEIHRKGDIDLTNYCYVQLDEYVGIEKSDKRNLYRWMKQVFLDQIGIAELQAIHFDSEAADEVIESEYIESTIEQIGGIGLCILGLGPNGHLGFNEPGSTFNTKTRVVDLTPESVKSNTRYWGKEELVPKRAFTLGLGTLKSAKKTLLLVSSAKKSKILAETLEGSITTEVPATMLRLMDDVTIIADKAAARDLKKY